MSYEEWTKTIGSVIIINFAKDIGSDALTAVSSSGSYNFSLNATIEETCDRLLPGINNVNPNVAYSTADPVQYAYKLKVLIINSGILAVTPASTTIQIAVDKSATLAALSQGNVDVFAHAAGGGGFFPSLDSVKRYLIPIVHKVQSALPTIEAKWNSLNQSLPIPQDFAKKVNKGFSYANYLTALGAKLLGAGMSTAQVKGALMGMPGASMADIQELKDFLSKHKAASAGKLEAGARGGAKIRKDRLHHY